MKLRITIETELGDLPESLAHLLGELVAAQAIGSLEREAIETLGSSCASRSHVEVDPAPSLTQDELRSIAHCIGNALCSITPSDPDAPILHSIREKIRIELERKKSIYFSK